MVRIRQIEHNARMRPTTAPVVKLPREINGPIEAQSAIGQHVNVQGLVVTGRVQDADVARLHEVVGDEEVLLVRGELDVVRAEGGLFLVWVVEALDGVEVGDVEGGDVVGGCEGEVGEAAVLGDVGAVRGHD